MSGVNFLDRLTERETEEGVVGEGTSIRSGMLESVGGALSELTPHQKTSLILLFLGFVLWYFQADLLSTFYFDAAIAEKNQVNLDLQRQVDTLKAEVKQFGELKTDIENFRKSMDDVKSKINEIDQIRRAKRDFAIRLTDYVVAELPEGVWLDGISVDVRGTRRVELRGHSLDFTLIGNYIQRLEKGAFFPKWTLVNTGNGKMPGEEQRDTRTFSIDAPITLEIQ